MNYLNNFIGKNIVLILLIQTLCLIFFILEKNILPNYTDWLLQGDLFDIPAMQVGWCYYKDSGWHFPPGQNPEYPINHNTSIVYNTQISIFAIFFKLLNFLLPDNFQYISLWFITCVFLQGIIAYKIIFIFTKDYSYSYFSCNFFLIAPILWYRMVPHASLAAHFLILYMFYVYFNKNLKKKNFLYLLTISISLLTHFYFFAICSIILFFFYLEFFLKQKKYFSICKKIILYFLTSITMMYLSGYFAIPVIQSMASGFGDYRSNIASFFDPFIKGSWYQDSWSFFLNDLPGHITDLEGFAYLGVGIIILTLYSLIFLVKNEKKFLKKYLTIIFLSIFFFLFSLSNKIYFLDFKILEFNIHPYLYGILGIIRSSGRFIWVVYYLILLFSLIYFFKISKKKNIILFFLFLQIIDVFPGIVSIKKLENFIDGKNTINDELTLNFFREKNIVKTTYEKGISEFYIPISKSLCKYKNQTNIYYLGRYNRSIASDNRSQFYETAYKKNLGEELFFIDPEFNHVLNLKIIYYNKSTFGFFFRDNFWSMKNNSKYLMNENDFKNIDKLNFEKIETNKLASLSNTNFKKYFGLGWSQDRSFNGIWSEGNYSTLLFRTNNNLNDFKLIINYTDNNDYLRNSEIRINGMKISKNSVRLKDNQLELFFVDLKTDKIKIDFIINNKILSDYDKLKSPDARKLGFLIKDFIITSL